MANFIISPYAISFNSIKNALQNYINDKNISSVIDTWSDFYTAGAGQTVVELDAAIAAFYAFHFIIGRREAYLPVAQNYSSILGGAETLGYCASRGHNVHFNLKILPNVTQTLTKWTTIGSFSEYDIILLDTATLTQGVESTLYCTIGNSNAQAITITSSEVQQFTFTAEDTTDDCRLILNDMEVPVAMDLEEAVNDKYIMLSNSYGSVDVFYLNQGGNKISYSVVKGETYGWTSTPGEINTTVNPTAKIYKDLIRSQSIVNDGDFTYTGSNYTSNYTYSTQDVLYLQYVQRNNLTYSALSIYAFDTDYGELIDMELVEDLKEVQSKDSIKLGASIYHENNNVIRARKDFCKYLLQDNTLNLVDANDYDINPGLMAVTYLKTIDDAGNSKLNELEKETYLEKVTKVSPDGVPDIYIEDPVAILKNLDITLWQKSNEVIPAEINENITDILKTYENVLQPKLDIEAIENALEKIEGVKIARVDIGAEDYELNKAYKPYDVVNVENVLVGNDYETWKMVCIKVKTKTSETAPDWGYAQNIGDRVVDSDLLWERTNKYISSIPYKWKEETAFNLYDDISVGYTIYPNCTSYTEPTWDKTTIIDGNVTFNKVKTYDYALSNWSANHRFGLNEYAIFSKNNQRAVYKVTGFMHKSGTSAPNWVDAETIDDTVIDNAITWSYKYNEYNVNSSYLAGDFVGRALNNKLYIYRAIKANNSNTVYWTNGKKKPTAQNPLDGTTFITELDDSTDTEGDIVWELQETLENYVTWAAETELGLNKYVKGGSKFFLSIDNSRSLTGTEDWFATLTNLRTTYTDNNVIWELDTYNIAGTDYNSLGNSWQPNKDYNVNDIIVVSDNDYSYLYRVVHTNDVINNSNNVIYTVVGIAGTSGVNPEWKYEQVTLEETIEVQHDTVIDGNILWTKTTDAPTKEWSENTVFFKGDIIATDIGNFVFTTIIGKSGTERPNWEGINNGVVEDNNLVWQKLSDNTVISLKWNEYLDLSYNLNPIK